jgi:hypothetical protein
VRLPASVALRHGLMPPTVQSFAGLLTFGRTVPEDPAVVRHDPAAEPLWLLQRGGRRVEAEIVPCPLGLWLRVWHGGDEPAFGLIRPASERAALAAEAEAQRRNYEARGFVALRPS